MQIYSQAFLAESARCRQAWLLADTSRLFTERLRLGGEIPLAY